MGDMDPSRPALRQLPPSSLPWTPAGTSFKSLTGTTRSVSLKHDIWKVDVAKMNVWNLNVYFIKWPDIPLILNR